MTKRNCRFDVRLTREEYEKLAAKSERAGLSRSAFARSAMLGKEIREAPPADVPMLIREVRRVEAVLEQLLMHALRTRSTDPREVAKAIGETRQVERMISQAYGTAWR